MRHLAFLFIRDHGGASSIEYAFLTSLIAMVIFGSLIALRENLTVPFAILASAFTG
jgi:Flp pilus assembly pilin Flp